MHALIEEVKAKNEDFEFYPTTDEIIFKVIKDLRFLKESSYNYSSFNFSSILDIGAGNGKVLRAIKKEFQGVDLYAIEKADTLKQLLDEQVYIVGTDFNEQSLLDKTIAVTFCNPPYSKYQEWAKKIIRESCSSFIYLVIPKRWIESVEIKEALKYRDVEYKTIGEYSFQDAEDRKARALVNLVRIDLSDKKEDAFEKFFNEEFKELKEKFDAAEEKEEKDDYGHSKEKENKFSALVLGNGYVKSLVQMYNAEIDKIKKNYLYVGKLDADLLKEFDISPSKILDLLKERLKGLKNLYWHELIGRMKEITDRLTTKKRRALLDTLNENAHVDFTESNIYAVVLWILKHAGQYIDEQLLFVYSEMISKANCRNYKSNKKVFEGDAWRYRQEKPTHVFLDYRLVLEYCGGFDSYCYRGYRLDERACEYIQDVLTLANNLGFKSSTDDSRLYRWGNDGVWYPGKPQMFDCYYKGKREKLIEVKAHKNGNIHVRLNQKFALALNVEYGRLKGWIHSGKEASEELKDTQAAQYFKSNFTLLKSPFLMLENKKIADVPKRNNTFNEKVTPIKLTTIYALNEKRPPVKKTTIYAFSAA